MTAATLQDIMQAQIVRKYAWQIAFIGFEENKSDITMVAVRHDLVKRKLKIRGLVAKVGGDDRLTEEFLYDVLVDHIKHNVEKGIRLTYTGETNEPLLVQTFHGLQVKDYQVFMNASSNEMMDYKLTLKYEKCIRGVGR